MESPSTHKQNQINTNPTTLVRAYKRYSCQVWERLTEEVRWRQGKICCINLWIRWIHQIYFRLILWWLFTVPNSYHQSQKSRKIWKVEIILEDWWRLKLRVWSWGGRVSRSIIWVEWSIWSKKAWMFYSQIRMILVSFFVCK